MISFFEWRSSPLRPCNRLVLLGCVLFLACSLRPCARADSSHPSLETTAWQLVKILSMDDTVYQPSEADVHTLVFGATGDLEIHSACNTGTAHWAIDLPSSIRFTAIETESHDCQPDSLSGRFLAQLEWVRSFVLRDGHLYLATMADGAIIEFRPLAADSVAGEATHDAYQ